MFSLTLSTKCLRISFWKSSNLFSSLTSINLLNAIANFFLFILGNSSWKQETIRQLLIICSIFLKSATESSSHKQCLYPPKHLSFVIFIQVSVFFSHVITVNTTPSFLFLAFSFSLRKYFLSFEKSSITSSFKEAQPKKTGLYFSVVSAVI